MELKTIMTTNEFLQYCREQNIDSVAAPIAHLLDRLDDNPVDGTINLAGVSGDELDEYIEPPMIDLYTDRHIITRTSDERQAHREIYKRLEEYKDGLMSLTIDFAPNSNENYKCADADGDTVLSFKRSEWAPMQKLLSRGVTSVGITLGGKIVRYDEHDGDNTCTNEIILGSIANTQVIEGKNRIWITLKPQNWMGYIKFDEGAIYVWLLEGGLNVLDILDTLENGLECLPEDPVTQQPISI